MSIYSRRQFLTFTAGAGLGAFAVASLGRRALAGGAQRIERSSRAFGTTISITVLHDDKDEADKAIKAAFDEIEIVEQSMSLYRNDSEICRLNRDGVLAKPHPYFLTVLKTAQKYSELSDGAFDVTVQPLWEVYAAAQKNGSLPSDKAIEAAAKNVGWKNIAIDDSGVKLKAGMGITFNGIAQGFGTDRALKALTDRGIKHALLNTGEVGSVGKKDNSEPWKIGIQHPREDDAFVALAALGGKCMATSGDYATTFSADRRFNHIFDPGTGRSPEAFSSVTIVAPTAMDADAMTKVVFVGGLERGLKLVAAIPGADAMIVRKDGTRVATNGFPFAKD